MAPDANATTPEASNRTLASARSLKSAVTQRWVEELGWILGSDSGVAAPVKCASSEGTIGLSALPASGLSNPAGVW